MTSFASPELEIRSIEEWMQNPPKEKEWVDGKLIDKHPRVWVEGTLIETEGMTITHSRIQLRLGRKWADYADSTGQGGEAYTEPPCRTNRQGRKPDVAYSTPALLAQFDNVEVLPQSFPLIAEIVSQSDFAEDVIAKAYEYLQSGGEEVWLLFPRNRWVIVVTQTSQKIFVSSEVVTTQVVLPGFSIAVDELLA